MITGIILAAGADWEEGQAASLRRGVPIQCGHLCSAVDVDTPEALDELRA